ncbi:MAG TPA: CHAT domain-containing protein, partial [Acidimicrobiales bacterium]|nr:CHAT domain-containing protein [Acidimicrobiales bacterium]
AAALRVELVKLAGRYPAEPGPRGEFDLGEHEAEVRLTFARVGARLHDLVFGSPAADNPLTALRADAARWISTVGRDGEATLQVADDAIVLPVPWGLLYDAGAYAAALGEHGQAVPPNLRPRPEAADQVDERCFWGRRFALSRFFPLPALSRPVVGGPDGVRVTPVLNCELGEPVVTNQRSLFAGGGGAGGGAATLVADDVIADPAALVAWAEAGDTRPSDVLYFFCHARSVAQFGPTGFPTGAADPGDAALGLAADDTGESVTVARLREAWNRRRERRPLVLLNACGSTQADAVYGVPFVQAFMGTWQARALVGTDWTIPTRFADPFSRRVVEGLRRGLTVAAALRAASLEAFAQGNLYPLMYALYGQPSVALVEAMP